MSKLTNGLPPVPPMEPEVRERILRTVLGRMEAPVPARRRWVLPLLTAAAVLLVAIVVSIATTTPRPASDPGPAAGVTATWQPPPPPDESAPSQVLDPLPPEPLPADQLPPPTGDAETDAAIARCATAVVRSGRAAEYPPTTTWRNATTGPADGEQYDRILSVGDQFGCLLTPESVILSGVTGTSVGGLQLVRISSGLVFVINPERLWFTFGDDPRQRAGFPVMAAALPPGQDADDLDLTVRERGDLPGSEPWGAGDSAFRWSGPVPELVQAVTVVDRELPRRGDTLDDAELANCVAGQSVTFTAPGTDLWTFAGRHQPDGAPAALLTRVGDVAVGVCVLDPSRGPLFTSGSLPALSVRNGYPLAMSTRTAFALLLRAPDDEPADIEIAPAADAGAARPCSVLDGFVVCTLEIERPDDQQPDPDVVVTAHSAGSPGGTVIYSSR